MILVGIGAAAATAAACGAYGVFIEAYRMGMTEVEFRFPNLPLEFDGFTILQLSDFHLKKETRIQKLCNDKLARKVMRLTAGLRFDMIAFTGDAEMRGGGFDAMEDLLKSIPSNHGVYFVPGNGEYQDYDINRCLDAMDSWGVTTLRNRSCYIERETSRVYLVGVDDPFTKHSDLETAMNGVPDSEFRILLAHSPSISREAIKNRFDLVISGHTHGGQVRLPFIGAPYTHLGKGSPRMDMGIFEGAKLSRRTGMDSGPTKVFVTRGIGMSDMYIRFLCPPEIARITLRRAENPL